MNNLAQIDFNKEWQPGQPGLGRVENSDKI